MVYDLTQAVRADLPIYPGDPTVKIESVATVANEGYAVSSVTLGSHTGTHIDAPAHMIMGGKQLKDYPADRFIAQAVCVDMRAGLDAGKLRRELYRPGLAVLLHTGASDYFHKEHYWHEYPVLDIAAISVLIGAQVPLVGIDAGSFDNVDSFPVHKALLGADILLLENLTGLAPLIGKQIELIALPLKLDADGAPCRVVARSA